MPINARFHATNFLRREAQGTLNIFSEGKPARSVSGHLKRAPSVESPRPESKKGIRRSDRTSIVPADSLGLAPPRTVRLVRPRSSTPLADILHNTGPSVVEKMNYRRVPSGDANSVRVLCPDYQADPPRRAHSAPRVRDSVGLLLSDRQGDIPSPRPQSVRTRFESIDAAHLVFLLRTRFCGHPAQRGHRDFFTKNSLCDSSKSIVTAWQSCNPHPPSSSKASSIAISMAICEGTSVV